MPAFNYGNMPLELRDGFRATNDWVHALEFEPPLLTPGAFIPDGTSTHGIVTSRWAAVVYPTAPTSHAYSSLATRPHWIDGNLRFTLFFSGPLASTNTVQWTLLTAGRAAGGKLSTHDVLVSENMAGPPTSNEIVEASFATQLPVDAADKLIVVRIGRTSPDAYADVANLVGVKVTYIPNKL